MQNFRKHPGGIKGMANFINVALIVGLIVSALTAIGSLAAMVTERASFNVITASSTKSDVVKQAFSVSNLRDSGYIHFVPRNVLEWLFTPRINELDLFLNLFTIAITWQLYRIFKDINMDEPFYEGIFKRVKRMHQLMLAGLIFLVLKQLYLTFVISDLTAGKYILTGASYFSSMGYFTIGTWVIVYLFAHVYKKGVVLQQESNLTI